MRKVKVLVLALLLSVLTTPIASAVYEGVDATGTPNVVSIVKEFSNGTRYAVCSGALISARVVVTAAHCVTDDQTGLIAKNIWVSPAGAAYKLISEGGKNYAILASASSIAESRAVYEQYLAMSIQVTSTYESTGTTVNDNDVAFIVLKKALPFNSNITIASDEETESLITNKSQVRIYGYGKTTFDSESSLTPKMATMNIDFKSTALKNSAYLKSPTSSACPGDSGGPVIASTPTKLYLVGIITGGSASTTGPACNNRIDGNFYTLITLITKYSNLAFSAAVLASQQSESDAVQAIGKIAADSKTAEAAAKLAQEKAVAEAKAVSEVAAKIAFEKAQSELVDANLALADAQKVNLERATRINSLEEQINTLSESVSVLQGQVSQLNTKLAAALAVQNAANAKLKKVCSAKPKPKGC